MTTFENMSLAEQQAYEEHEMACNIAEDMDCGAIFPWRLEQVKAHLAAGGTTAIDRHGELVLVMSEASKGA